MERKLYTFCCKKCGKEYSLLLSDAELKSDRYSHHCSRACANSRIFTEETKQKTRESIKKYIEQHGHFQKQPCEKPLEYATCEQCGKLFIVNHDKKINRFCSEICFNSWYIERRKKLINDDDEPQYKWGRCSTPEKETERRRKISKAMKGNDHWKYNKKHGRGNQGRYMGFWCDSSWELAFIIYHLDHNIPIKRCTEVRKYIFENKEHKYIPDFVTDKGIIEIKGFKTEQWKSKIQQNPDIIVLYESDMKPFIDYVVKTYGKNFCEKFYEK